MFDPQRFVQFLSDPMAAQKAADLPIDPQKFYSSLELGLKPQGGLGLQPPAPGGAPDGIGLKVPEMGMADVKNLTAQPGPDWMKLLQMAGPGMSQGLQQPQQRLSPPGHVFVGGPRQVQLNPYQTTPMRK